MFVFINGLNIIFNYIRVVSLCFFLVSLVLIYLNLKQYNLISTLLLCKIIFKFAFFKSKVFIFLKQKKIF